MAKLHEIYTCSSCGNIVQVVHEGGGTLVCCNEDMLLQKERTDDEGKEKHVPVLEQTDNGMKVKIGAVPHPMTKEHHIEWIEMIKEDKAGKHFLDPNGSPETIFPLKEEPKEIRCYCNLHGLWKK